MLGIPVQCHIATAGAGAGVIQWKPSAKAARQVGVRKTLLTSKKLRTPEHSWVKGARERPRERQVSSGHPRSRPTDTFYPKGGALGGLPHTCEDVLVEVGAKGLHQPNCGRALPFSQGCWSYSSRWKPKRKITSRGIKLMWITEARSNRS